jgi:transcriptional regulator with XRE-family HTH domain/tetratricopeptide (TPR) repeat protein
MLAVHYGGVRDRDGGTAMASRRRGFASARKAAGYTQESLAEALNVDRTTVIRWEAGDNEPQPHYWPKLTRLLGISADELRRLLAVPANPADTVVPPAAPAVELLDLDGPALDRRSLLRGAAAATLGLHDAEMLRCELAAEVDHAAMSEASLDDWEHTVYRYGLASGYRPAASLLADLTADFVELQRLLERRRAILVPNRLTRVMAQMAGLMTIPLNKLDQAAAARNWARIAKLIASQAGDNKLHAWVLGQEAYAHYYSGNLTEALYVATYAQRIANQAPCPGVAHAAALEARAHASFGRPKETCAAIDRAEQALSGMGAAELTPSAFGYDKARLYFHSGNAYTHLGQTAAAFDAHEQALELYPANSYFDRALVILDRADCFIHDNDIPIAAEWATKALQSIGTEQRNPLIDNRTRQVLDHIPTTAATLPAVRELRESFQEIVGE